MAILPGMRSGIDSGGWRTLKVGYTILPAFFVGKVGITNLDQQAFSDL
jgi:hypothetical protein